MVVMQVFRISILCLAVFAVVLVPGDGALAGAKSRVQESEEGTGDKAEKKTRADWAEIRLSGEYPEGIAMPGLFGELVESLSLAQDRLQQAARDKSIKGVLLKIEDVSVGFGKLNELRAAIADIRGQGKPVWAILNDGGNLDYLLAASCDRILMPESGTLMLTGLRAEVTFYKNLFEMLDIKADMLRVGAFKSAAEPYTRAEMSDEFRAELESILDDHYLDMVQQIAAGRKLSEEVVRGAIDQGLLSARQARELGLVDDLAYEDELVRRIQGDNQSLDVRIREDYRKKKVSAELDLFALMELLSGSAAHTGSTRPRIAVLRLEGEIVAGDDALGFLSSTSISSKQIVPLIHKLSADENVKAIVLRVDSPGGSALASDLIWRALEASGKPVVASMGDTAASGGYYISMGADCIFAEPGTITGSIGVVGGKIALDGLMRKAGVTTSVIRRGRNAGVLSPFQSFSDSERDAMQASLNNVYDQFTRKAASGRKMDVVRLEELARGRIYTGRQAQQLGLIDNLGTLADAIAHARTLAGDDGDKLELEDLPHPKSPLEMLMGDSQPSGQPFDALARMLPQSAAAAIEHLNALQLLMNEPALMMLPYSVRFE